MIILDVGDNFLHTLLAYRLVDRRWCRCGREVFDRHDDEDPCPACLAEARDLSENMMIDLLMEEAS